MKIIYKFPLAITDVQFIDIPDATVSQILSAGLDAGGNPCIWAVVETPVPTSSRIRVDICGTGNPIAEDDGDPNLPRYVGTFTTRFFVWHAFATLV